MCTRHEQMPACIAELVQEVSQASEATLLTALNDVPHFRCHFTNAALNLSSSLIFDLWVSKHAKTVSTFSDCCRPCTLHPRAKHKRTEGSDKSFQAPHLERIESPASLTLPLGRPGQTWNVAWISYHLLIKALMMAMSLLIVHSNIKQSVMNITRYLQCVTIS